MDQGTSNGLAGRSHIIDRPRLTRLLDQATSRIIMLVAPAGYGKTTLAQQWLADKPHAWYQSKGSSADIAALIAGLSTATCGVSATVGHRASERVRATHQPESDAEILATLMAEDLASWPHDAWLAIDDYHFIASSPVAERFVEQLISGSAMNIVVTARRRPAWATARRILYGEIYELGPAALAMTEEEADVILGETGPDQVSGLVALAQGWPAVIGLAAHVAARSVPDEVGPDTLFDYFAEELYQTAASRTRMGMMRLALVDSFDRELGVALVGSDADEVIGDGLSDGFINGGSGGRLALHPLLRAFVDRKLHDLPLDERRRISSDVLRTLLERREWDSAFDVIKRTRASDQLPSLIADALGPMLREGRLATLKSWLDYGRDAEVADPILDLGDAELAFRRGAHEQAEVLADQAAAQMDQDHPLVARALVRAGQSAYLQDRLSDSVDYFRRARGAAQDNRDKSEALWCAFISLLDLSQTEAADELAAYVRLQGDGPDDVLRTANARLVLATRRGRLTDALSHAKRAEHIAPRSSDPMILTAFWNVYGAALVLAAKYAKALAAADEELSIADRYRLDFVRPHGLLLKSAACVGLRRFSVARGHLRRLFDEDWHRHARHVDMTARMLEARIRLAEGRAADAVGVLKTDVLSDSHTVDAEYAAMRALALACADRREESSELASIAAGSEFHLEGRVIAEFTQAILEIQCGRGERATQAAFRTMTETGDIDGFVSAYRGFPPLLAQVAAFEEGQRSLEQIVGSGNDTALAQAQGVPVSAPRRNEPGTTLSPREREVHDLLRDGLSNREIAQVLFISEATAKVHVRHILEKLGVRTRTEAAVIASVPPP
jgi:ATP/maltotriose-dependent transcriptional regulator MalT